MTVPGEDVGHFVPDCRIARYADGTISVDIDDLMEELAGEPEIKDDLAVPILVETFHNGEEDFMGEVLDIAWFRYEGVHDSFSGCTCQLLVQKRKMGGRKRT